MTSIIIFDCRSSTHTLCIIQNENILTSLQNYNDGVHNTIFDVIIILFVVAHGLSYEIAFNLPEPSDDLSFRRLFLKSSVDIAKYIKGNRGNFIIAFQMDHYMYQRF